MGVVRLITRAKLSKLWKINRKFRERLFERIAEEKRVAEINKQLKERKKAHYLRYSTGELYIVIGGLAKLVKDGEEPQEGDEIEDRVNGEATEPVTPKDFTSKGAPPRRGIAQAAPASEAFSRPVDHSALTSRLQNLTESLSQDQSAEETKDVATEDAPDLSGIFSGELTPVAPPSPPPRPPRNPLRPRSPSPIPSQSSSQPSSTAAAPATTVADMSSSQPPAQMTPLLPTATEAFVPSIPTSVPASAAPVPPFVPQPLQSLPSSQPQSAHQQSHAEAFQFPQTSQQVPLQNTTPVAPHYTPPAHSHGFASQPAVQVSQPAPQPFATQTFNTPPPLVTTAQATPSQGFSPFHRHTSSPAVTTPWQGGYIGSHPQTAPAVQPFAPQYPPQPPQRSPFEFLLMPAQPKVYRRKCTPKKCYTVEPRPRHHVPTRFSGRARLRPGQWNPMSSSSRRPERLRITYRTRQHHFQPRQLVSAVSRRKTKSIAQSIRHRYHKLRQLYRRRIGYQPSMYAVAAGTRILRRIRWETYKRRQMLEAAKIREMLAMHRQRVISVTMEDDFSAEASRSSGVDVSSSFHQGRPEVPERPSVETSAAMNRLSRMYGQSSNSQTTSKAVKNSTVDDVDNSVVQHLADRISEHLLQKVPAEETSSLESAPAATDNAKASCSKKVTIEDVPEEEEECTHTSSPAVQPEAPPMPSRPQPPQAPSTPSSSSGSPSPASSSSSLPSSCPQPESIPSASSSRPFKRSRRLAGSYSPYLWSAEMSFMSSDQGGFRLTRPPKRWTPEEDEEIIAKFRPKRRKLAPIKVSPRKSRRKADVYVDTAPPTISHPPPSSTDESSSNVSEDEMSLGCSSPLPPTPGCFVEQRPVRKSPMANSKSSSLCENLIPIVGVLGPLLVFSSWL